MRPSSSSRLSGPRIPANASELIDRPARLFAGSWESTRATKACSPLQAMTTTMRGESLRFDSRDAAATIAVGTARSFALLSSASIAAATHASRVAVKPPGPMETTISSKSVAVALQRRNRSAMAGSSTSSCRLLVSSPRSASTRSPSAKSTPGVGMLGLVASIASVSTARG